MIEFGIQPGTIDQIKWAAMDLGDAGEFSRQSWSMTMQGGQSPVVRHGSEHLRAVRVIYNGRLGLASSRTDAWDSLLREARLAALSGPEASMDVSEVPGGRMYVSKSHWDPQMLPKMDVTLRYLYENLQELSPDFRPSVTVSYHERTTHFVTSLGGQAAWLHGYWEVAAGGRHVDGTDFHGVSGVRIKGDGIPDIASLINDLRDRFQWGKSRRTIESGQYPIVFLPPVAMGLLGPVLARLSGPALVAGNSPWKGQQDQQVLSSMFSLFSDATVPDGPQTGPFDDEGTATGRHPLIAEGILKHFVLDRDASRQLGHEPDGMGYRTSFNAPIQSLPANLMIEPGAASFSQLLNRFPQLLVLNGWIGGRPTNPMRGDIAGNASDLYCAESGIVVGRVKNAVISVNAFEALRGQLLEVGQEAQWVTHGMMQAAPGNIPPLLIDRVDVALKQ